MSLSLFFFFLNNVIYLFIYLWLCWVFACSGFSLVAVPGLLIVAASLVAEHGPWGLRASAPVAPASRAQAQCLWRVGLVALGPVGSAQIRGEPVSSALAGGFFTTELPGKPSMSLHLAFIFL